MGVLKCFSGLKVGAYIQHRLSFKSFAFVNSSVQEVCLCFGYFSRKLDSLMLFVSLLNELCDTSLVLFQREKMSSMNRFQTSGFKAL